RLDGAAGRVEQALTDHPKELHERFVNQVVRLLLVGEQTARVAAQRAGVAHVEQSETAVVTGKGFARARHAGAVRHHPALLEGGTTLLRRDRARLREKLRAPQDRLTAAR